MQLKGRSLIGSRDGNEGKTTFHAFNPTTGQAIQPPFYPATENEVDLAAKLAGDAFPIYSRLPGDKKAAFLSSIASNIEAIGEPLIERAHLETALPKPRLQGETARTCHQLRLFARVVVEGSWTMARIDRPDSDRKPAPKPDIRSLLRPLGPVVVFGSSNFPLAFSVAGGDTASAFAAGNPVIVKAHSAHPGTSELAGEAVRRSVRDCGLPEGVFSLVFGAGASIGTRLVQHPIVKAGGFTGSAYAGRTLANLAASRPEPIPFYAEMGSTNPVFLLPGAIRDRSEQIAADLYASFTLGAGQFCTKPGLIFVSEGKPSAKFVSELQRRVADAPEYALLTSGIRASYRREVTHRESHDGLRLVAGSASSSGAGFTVGATLFQTEISAFLANPEFSREVFGPSTLLICYSSKEQILEAARNLQGHLTATVHGTEEDLHEFGDLVAILETKVGRIIFNGFPTGVEVCHAMIHGGPYPATSDSRTTSVGTQAIYRFVRPVCYQSVPDSALPLELRNANPLGIWRMVDGELTRQPL
jgi:NADP-dependent aldehyde dehydrogenase